MSNEEPQKRARATVKVCLDKNCCEKGAKEVYANLKAGLPKEEVLVLPVSECMNFCEEGPLIALNDNIVKGVKPFLAVETVQQELSDPSCKADGLGSKKIDRLDELLDEMTNSQ